MTDSPLTWEDVNWLRREAARRDRLARTTKDPQAAEASKREAERARSLARRISERIQRGEAA